ncbi:MAG: TPM domain-containing protein [Oscillospiraceae bacterium]
MPDENMDSIEPFDYQALKPFSNAYLPGTWRSIRVSNRHFPRRYPLQSQLRKCPAQHRHRLYHLHPGDADRPHPPRQVQYALLPVWMLPRSGRQGLPFSMNGQTGKLTGDLPVSWVSSGRTSPGSRAASPLCCPCCCSRCKEGTGMKKRIICLLAALLLLLGLSVSASAAVYANVIDTAELLSESEAEALDARCSELEQTYGCGVYLMTVDDYTAYYSADSIESFAESVFLDLGLGAGEEQDGVLLVLSMAERDYDICAHGTIGNRAFTDYGKGVLAERWFLEPFSRDDWSGGFAAFLDGCEEYLRMDAEGAPFDQGTDPERLGDLAVVKWLVVILVPLLTALVVCLVMKGKMKSARLQTQADAYITQDSLRLTRQDDRYITTTQTRVKIETAKSGGTSVNSGGFSHSSGKF